MLISLIFYKSFIKLAIPIISLQVLSTSVTLISSLMIGQLGESSIVAVGFCNQFFQMFNLLMIGLVNGTAIFTAQFWGKKDFRGMRQMFMVSLVLTEMVALVFFVTCQSNPQMVLGLFTNDKDIIILGAGYLSAIRNSFTASTYFA